MIDVSLKIKAVFVGSAFLLKVSFFAISRRFTVASFIDDFTMLSIRVIAYNFNLNDDLPGACYVINSKLKYKGVQIIN